jgi:putative aminopeptidase FrvX
VKAAGAAVAAALLLVALSAALVILSDGAPPAHGAPSLDVPADRSRAALSAASDSLLVRLASLTAVTGFEDAAAESVLAWLPGAELDRAGNVIWKSGSGGPVRLAACPLDEPGHVVAGVTAEGYLTLRRAGRPPPGTSPERFLEGQRVTVFGAAGAVPGVVGVLSTHLQRSRSGAEGHVPGREPLPLDDALVDVGASSAEEVDALGLRVLAPVARVKAPLRYGRDLVAAPSAAARGACAALLAAARLAAQEGIRDGAAVAAFTRRRYFGWDGAAFAVASAAGTEAPGPPGAGVQAVLLGDPAPDDSLGRGAYSIAEGGPEGFPDLARVVRWSLPARYVSSPVETVSSSDVEHLSRRLAAFLTGATPPAAEARRTGAVSQPAPETASSRERPSSSPAGDRLAAAAAVLARLVGTYAVSGAEEPMREAVKGLLPEWAAVRTDGVGNLRLRVGAGAPLVVIVAHLDEIGYSVTRIREDGGLEIEPRGGFYGSLFEGEAALVHASGGPVPAVFAPRDSFDASPPASLAGSPGGPPFVDPGTRSRAETQALGIRPGDTVTMPKQLTSLAGSRVTGRALDDRVGCAALILALSALDRSRLSHAVEFVWSVEEEIGLNGAEWAARDLASERPARVHAVDTFVTSDAPLERRAFAYAPLGRGAAIRAVDDSAVAPPALVDSLVTLAAGLGIPLQVGATSGGNDGSAFTRYGVPDVAIGWPLRYSHSPAEVMDLADLLALADLVRAVAERW